MTKNMNNWNEFAKEMNDLMTKNNEVITKYWKVAFDQGDEMMKRNMETYFSNLTTSVDYLRNIWETGIKDRDELATAYRNGMEKAYGSFRKVYEETVGKTTGTTK